MAIRFENGKEIFERSKAFLGRFADLFRQKEEPREIISPLGPTPTPTPTPIPLEDKFRKGFEQYGSDLATASSKFATEAVENPLPDPFLPAVLSLMETSGGKKQRFKFNPFNWGMQDMPSLEYAIKRIYSGIGKRFPYYEEYRRTGNLKDFFKHYTPVRPGNPPIDELIRKYNILRKHFD